MHGRMTNDGWGMVSARLRTMSNISEFYLGSPVSFFPTARGWIGFIQSNYARRSVGSFSFYLYTLLIFTSPDGGCDLDTFPRFFPGLTNEQPRYLTICRLSHLVSHLAITEDDFTTEIPKTPLTLDRNWKDITTESSYFAIYQSIATDFSTVQGSFFSYNQPEITGIVCDFVYLCFTFGKKKKKEELFKKKINNNHHASENRRFLFHPTPQQTVIWNTSFNNRTKRFKRQTWR